MAPKIQLAPEERTAFDNLTDALRDIANLDAASTETLLAWLAGGGPVGVEPVLVAAAHGAIEGILNDHPEPPNLWEEQVDGRLRKVG